MRKLVSLVLAASLATLALSLPLLEEPFSDCDGKSPNVKPFWTGEPVLLKTVPNGKLFRAGDGTSTNTTVLVIHLYGSPKERGIAHGQLVADEIKELYSNFHGYINDQIEQYTKKYLPEFVRKAFEKHGVPAVLQLSWDVLRPYTPQHFIDEMEGLAQGAGVDVKEVFHMHAFPEVIRAACSMMGASNEATAETNGGGLTVLRALDWGIDNPLRKFPAVIVYHANDASTNSVATLSWTGFIAALTGYSYEMAVTEKVWYTDHPKQFWPHGYPWAFLMRDILEFDRNLDQAETRIRTATKTAAIYMGVGSRADNRFLVNEYGIRTDNVFNDSTPFPGFRPQVEQHPLMKGLVYVDKHTQPSGSWCMAKELQRRYGAIDATAAKELCSLMQTGDIHLAFSDFAANDFYVSVATTNDAAVGPILNAYDNDWIRLNMTREFAITQ